MLRGIKYFVGAFLALIVGGFLLIGPQFRSYVRTSARSVQDSVTEAVPLEFELRRARDMIEAILPDLQAQVRVIAQEEVAIAALEQDVEENSARLDKEQHVLSALRDQMRVSQVAYTVGNREMSRKQVTEQIHQRFQRYKQGEMAIDSKSRLLEKRREGLHSALALLDKMRHRKVELEQKAETLAAQTRLLKASQIESGTLIDGTELSQADQLLSQIETRLAVAQRVLTHQQDDFEIQLDDVMVSEQNVLAAYDEHFSDHGIAADPAPSETMVSLDRSDH